MVSCRKGLTLTTIFMFLLLLNSCSGSGSGSGIVGFPVGVTSTPTTPTTTPTTNTGCKGSSPTWNCSPDYKSLNNLINNNDPGAVQIGDTINLSPGNADWGTSTLTISKAIKLIGVGSSGSNITAITSTAAYAIIVNTGNEGSFPFRISGIKIHKSSGAYCIFVDGAGKDWRIDNNRFEGIQDGFYPTGVQINATGAVMKLYGVIDSNYFFWSSIGVGTSQSAPWKESWTRPHIWGDENAVYIENNIIDWEVNTSTQLHTVIDTNSGARIVVRYNIFKDGILASHSTCGLTRVGGRSIEAYNNQFLLTNKNASGTIGYVRNRGGGLIATRNVVAGNWAVYAYKGGITVDNQRSVVAENGCDKGVGWCNGNSTIDNNDESSGYMCDTQPGAGTKVSGKYTSDPMYAWGNSATSICTAGTNKWQLGCSTDSNCGTGGTCYSGADLLPNSIYVSTDGRNRTHIQASRNYFDDTTGGNIKTSWLPYDCPHPQAGTGTCNTDIAGTAGYSLNSSP